MCKSAWLDSASRVRAKVITTDIIFLFILQCSLDVSFNQLTGTIPTEIGVMSALSTINAVSNQIRGTIPNEMLNLNRNLRLNFTDNL